MKGAFVWDRNLLLFSIPVLIFLINLIPFYALPFHSKLDYFNIAHLNQHINGYLFLNVKQQYLFIAIYNTSFILYGAWFINRMKIGSGIYIKKKVNILITRIFIVTFLTVIPSIVIMFLLYLDSNQTGFINFFNPQMVNNNYLFFQSLVLPLSFFFIPNWLYNEKEPFSFLDGFSKNRKKFIDSVSKDSVDLQSAKNSDLDLILSFIETEKPYLNPRFSLHDISRSLNIPHLRVSNCFNSALKMPFPTYRNKLRIDYVTNLLQTSSHKTISIEGIAEMSGFKSKSIFYKVFKEEHGMTPIDWIKSNNL
jgi:AraC-like DNA-binding protein